jgi:hypothetical protein
MLALLLPYLGDSTMPESKAQAHPPFGQELKRRELIQPLLILHSAQDLRKS